MWVIIGIIAFFFFLATIALVHHFNGLQQLIKESKTSDTVLYRGFILKRSEANKWVMVDKTGTHIFNTVIDAADYINVNDEL